MLQTVLCYELEFDMAEISSAGLNNYVAKQATQQSQSNINIGDGDQKKRSNVAIDKVTAGVIVQISREARDLIKAKLDHSELDVVLSKRNSQNNLQSSIISAKFRRNEKIDKIAPQELDLYENLSETKFEKDILAA